MDYERLREVLEYNEDTGVFTWKVNKIYKCSKGTKAGKINNVGYVSIGIDGRQYLAHRLAWLSYYGYLPENCIDHINGDKTDNSIHNLREVSKSCNAFNSKINVLNKSGIKGVSLDTKRNKYSVRIKSKNKYLFIGRFVDITEAAAHRLAAEQCLGTDFCERSSAFEFIDNYRRRNY